MTSWWKKKPVAEDQLKAEAEAQNARENVWAKDSDLQGKLKQHEEQRASWWSTLFLAYSSLGVIYGDIGTSIIYVFAQVFEPIKGFTTDDGDELRDGVLGAISLIFWTLTLLALVKYVGVVLRANDTGEGGTVALYAQLCRIMGISPFGTMRRQDHRQVLAMRSAVSFQGDRPNIGEHRHRSSSNSSKDPLPLFKPWHPPVGLAVLEGSYLVSWFRKHRMAQRMLLLITMVATGLVIGDGILMPAFSVNSAISGIEQHTGGVVDSGGIVGISVAIIVVLFVSQHFGTQKIAFLFSPIIILWLLANLGIAIYNLHSYGAEVFQGLNPQYIFIFFNQYHRQGWEMLGGIMLCVSGTETMFAAMGHFSQPAVALAFGCFAYPCLMLSYLGQGAYLLQHPEDAHVTFWASIPNPIFWPMLVLATLAAIVASQAVITGTFSIIRQATALGVFPKLRVVHTDSFVEGRIFIPSINYMLMLLCIAVIAGFGGDNTKLGDAYGVAVMMVMLITTAMVTLIMLVKWDVSVLVVIPFVLLFTLIEGVFLSANLFKVPYGGWFPLAVAAVVCIIMGAWWSGSYSRRKVLLRTSKEQDAPSYFMIFSEDPAPLPERADSQGSLGGRSEVGSAVDLRAVHVTSAGYATESPPKALSQTRQPLPQPALIRTSATAAAAPRGGAAVDGDGVAPLRFSDVNGSASPRVRFVDPGDVALRPSSPHWFPKSSLHTMSLNKSSMTSNPVTELLPKPKPTLALVSCPSKPLGKLSGLGLYYSDSPIGIPMVMQHFLKNADALHQAGIIVTVRFLPMPVIKNVERLLVRAVQGLPNYYQVVARYGYQDTVDHSERFVQQIITTIMHKLELKAGLMYQGLEDDYIHELEGDEVDDDTTVQQDNTHSRVFGLETVHENYFNEEEEEEGEERRGTSQDPGAPQSPFISKFSNTVMARIKIVATAPDAGEAARDALDAARALMETANERVVYYLGRSSTRVQHGQTLLHKVTIGGLYRSLEMFAYQDSEAWHIPVEHMVELGMALEI